jgi:predicted membrane channel-forming protein YqfA (hemolysin III family)
MAKIVSNIAARSDAVVDAYIRKRYAILFYSLLLTFGASPLFAALQWKSSFIEILLAATLLVAVLPVRTVSVRWTLWILVGLALVMRFASVDLGPSFSSINLGIFTLVGLLAAVNALRFTFRAASIDSAHIYAALSAYLLAGISFGVLYWVIEHTWPGSLLYGGGSVENFGTADGIYFSFVTLATLGYGDFVPKTEVARGLAVLEAVAGQLYLGVMVARLVSLYVSGTAAKKEG